jgi:tRNA(fMet)-specific endonuclease VapC
LNEKIALVEIENCYVSEITIAELKYGAENSQNEEKNREVVDSFIDKFTILPIYESLDIYAKEKARLRKIGKPLDDFDLLIGSTSIVHRLRLATRNTSHFNRLKGIQVENWVTERFP